MQVDNSFTFLQKAASSYPNYSRCCIYKLPLRYERCKIKFNLFISSLSKIWLLWHLSEEHENVIIFMNLYRPGYFSHFSQSRFTRNLSFRYLDANQVGFDITMHFNSCSLPKCHMSGIERPLFSLLGQIHAFILHYFLSTVFKSKSHLNGCKTLSIIAIIINILTFWFYW